jgi:uncharacterized protein (TIGR00730 family)
MRSGAVPTTPPKTILIFSSMDEALNDSTSSTPNSWGKDSSDHREKSFLKGSSTLLYDLHRVNCIWLELLTGSFKFRSVGPCVTVFGSARFAEDHRYYELARSIGRRVASLGLTVMTGGGPGIMEAANRGARDVSGKSIGCNIKLPKEQNHNQYLDKWITFEHFFVRKIMLIKYSYAFIVLPGGFGTLDEVFETLTLIQTKKIRDFPIIMMGLDFWTPFRSLIEDKLLSEQTITKKDLSLLHFTDSCDEAIQCIAACGSNKFGLQFSTANSDCVLCTHSKDGFPANR